MREDTWVALFSLLLYLVGKAALNRPRVGRQEGNPPHVLKGCLGGRTLGAYLSLFSFSVD